jgi:hypothetical protein
LAVLLQILITEEIDKVTRRKWSLGYWGSWSILILLAGCGGPPKAVGLFDLESPDPATRIRAIKWAGDNHRFDAAPLLVDRLQEQDVSVRFYAIMSLKRITGTDHGYDYKAGAAERAQAVARWREAVNQRDGWEDK